MIECKIKMRKYNEIKEKNIIKKVSVLIEYFHLSPNVDSFNTHPE